MILITTNNIEGQPVKEYLGLVTADAIIGANLFKDLFAAITNVVGGRARSYEKVLSEAKDNALEEMQEKASSLGANAVIGIALDYGVIGKSGSMLMVSASGTAVRV